ncbi:MAG: phenylalanine--tRNA ligase subunit beta, partial [Proteobacteria bacterium]|nr:phenylalanine--tRNA ligase subunit beta [Pseudomonadota bacterium]
TPQPIVCGAPNVRAGLKVAVALPGAVLPGGLEIKEAVLRGQTSCGMICSSQELGMGGNQEQGILELAQDAPVGMDLREYLQLNDQIVDIAITANRGDCLSIKGLARETAALLKLGNRPLNIDKIPAKIPDVLKIEIIAPKRCSRYQGRVIRNIKTAVQSPVWLQERLRRAGLRSIHPVVDVTNYVMLELGQPLHAFDLRAIDEQIVVRTAQPGEKLQLLDGRNLLLDAEDLVVADVHKPLALAGIMGGQDSGVVSETKDLFLESAFFQAIPLSLTARRYGLQSDSAYRYSRGVDFELPSQAIERATQLLVAIVGGEPGPVIDKTDFNDLPKPASILLRKSQIARLLGIEIPDGEVKQNLESLGMQVQSIPEGWAVLAPSYRYDIHLEVDLIEELGRLHGYHQIAPQPMGFLTQSVIQKSKIPPSRWLNLLVDRGYGEAITYSFISPHWQKLLDPVHTPLILSNPISAELSVMRTSLWPGLLQALQYNQNRQASRVKLFEYGLNFIHDRNQIHQVPALGGVASGLAYPEQWATEARPLDFFDIKSDVEALLQLTHLKLSVTWQPNPHPALHPGQAAEILYKNERIGWVGALHPALIPQLNLNGPVYLFELKLDMINSSQLNEFKNISKFPGVRRDIAITLSKTVPADAIIKFIRIASGKLLNNVQIFDVYQGQNIEEGQKSIALSLIFQDVAKTLKDSEIQALVDDIVKGLAHEFSAKLRV